MGTQVSALMTTGVNHGMRGFRMPFEQLTRHGMPKFVVARREMVVGGVTYEVGQEIPEVIAASRSKVRGFYESQLIVPVDIPQAKIPETVPVVTAPVAPVAPVDGIVTPPVDVIDPLLSGGTPVDVDDDDEDILLQDGDVLTPVATTVMASAAQVSSPVVAAQNSNPSPAPAQSKNFSKKK